MILREKVQISLPGIEILGLSFVLTIEDEIQLEEFFQELGEMINTFLNVPKIRIFLDFFLKPSFIEDERFFEKLQSDERIDSQISEQDDGIYFLIAVKTENFIYFNNKYPGLNRVVKPIKKNK